MIDVTERLTDRINRAKLALEVRRGAGPFVVTLIGIGIGLACAVWVLSNVSKVALSSTRTVQFAVADANGVVAGRDQVRVKGIPAGQITGVSMHDQQVVVTAKVQKQFGKIYRDARAELRPDTPLEDIHLDIVDRGTPAAGEARDGKPLAIAQTATQVQVEDALDTFQPDVRAHLRALLNNLGNGLADRGNALRQAFDLAVPVLRSADRLSGQLAERDRRVRLLVRNSADLTEELGRRETELRSLIGNGGQLFAALANEKPSLDATLAELPPTLTAATGSLRSVDHVVADVDTAVLKLGPVADQLPTSLHDVAALGRELAPAVSALRPAVKRLVPLSQSLKPLASGLSTSMTTLRPQIPSIDRTTSLLKQCEDPVARFFIWQPTTGVFDDKRGTMLRADLQLAGNALGAANTPRRYAAKTCTGDSTLGGRPAEAKDKR